jgi:hypothetical protein
MFMPVPSPLPVGLSRRHLIRDGVITTSPNRRFAGAGATAAGADRVNQTVEDDFGAVKMWGKGFPRVSGRLSECIVDC